MCTFNSDDVYFQGPWPSPRRASQGQLAARRHHHNQGPVCFLLVGCGRVGGEGEGAAEAGARARAVPFGGRSWGLVRDLGLGVWGSSGVVRDLVAAADKQAATSNTTTTGREYKCPAPQNDAWPGTGVGKPTSGPRIPKRGRRLSPPHTYTQQERQLASASKPRWPLGPSSPIRPVRGPIIKECRYNCRYNATNARGPAGARRSISGTVWHADNQGVLPGHEPPGPALGLFASKDQP